MTRCTNAVGIDGDNFMIPIAWAVIDVESKRNWEWFIKILIANVGMYNSKAWTFIFTNKEFGKLY